MNSILSNRRVLLLPSALLITYMNHSTEHANDFASDESMTVNKENETTEQPKDHNDTSRSFGVTDIWNIRRVAKKFKIHDRIPRL